ncbi:hypothetical protein B0H14DRAFT_3857169 [Mycena olivaceomarginata]|nr:hypothetical protein B0H14DRAFT_3857169 [Mycena olivaceomarginata]
MSGLLDKGKELLAKSGNHNTSAQGNPGGEDYVDKALDALERKQGMASNRNTNEKITDGARNAFEKVTGHTVSSKISN